jgi:hypothetical protein
MQKQVKNHPQKNGVTHVDAGWGLYIFWTGSGPKRELGMRDWVGYEWPILNSILGLLLRLS